MRSFRKIIDEQVDLPNETSILCNEHKLLKSIIVFVFLFFLIEPKINCYEI